MEIIEVKNRTETLINKLHTVWEKSVKETHLFLTDSEIETISKYVPSALKEIPHLITISNPANEPLAFMGIEGRKLEMLFVSPEERGHGLGKTLLQHGIEHYDIYELGVNEQNPQAKGFYEHMGFQTYKRTDLDEQGNPYPILYMKLMK